MYPTISHLIEDLFGIYIPLPIQTFGFCMAMAFLFASFFLIKEFKRKEAEGLLKSIRIKVIISKKLSLLDIISNLITGFILGFKGLEGIIYYSDLVNNPQEFILSSRGNLLGGVLLSIIFLLYKWNENNKNKLNKEKEIEKIIHPYELVGNITMIAAISGIIGAKLFHNLENFNNFINNPIQELISFGGFTFYGGLIIAAFSVIWYTKKYKINTLHLLDSIAPSLMLAYGIGRIGCQLSGDGDWGIINLAPKPDMLYYLPDWMWSYTFPNNVINAGIPIEGCIGNFCMELPYPVWPTSFYETVLSFLIFGFLWIIRKRIKIAGILFSIYLVFNGIERFFIEKIRINTEYNIFGGVTQAEIISLFLIILGILSAIFLYYRKRN